MAKDPLKPQLWTERSVDETIEVYRDWADTYDSDLAKRGYHTPARIADMLAPHLEGNSRPVLDFGCGTGVSGAALTSRGIGPLHGTDITDSMVEIAKRKGLYEKLWVGVPGDRPAEPGTYAAIVAAGVVSLGAAPAETLDTLVDALAPGDLLALSFNDPTLAHGGYDARLDGLIDAGRIEILERTHGPHLDDLEMGSDVILLRRT